MSAGDGDDKKNECSGSWDNLEDEPCDDSDEDAAVSPPKRNKLSAEEALALAARRKLDAALEKKRLRDELDYLSGEEEEDE